MKLSLNEAAVRLGKTRRQIRYLIQKGELEAEKVGGHWFFDSKTLPLSEGQKQASERKQRQLRAAVEEALDIESQQGQKRRYSVKDMKAFQIALASYREITQVLGADHSAVLALRQSLEYLSLGCHRFERSSKVDAYRVARDKASLAICELVLQSGKETDTMIDALEQDLMPAFAGLLRRIDKSQRPDAF